MTAGSTQKLDGDLSCGEVAHFRDDEHMFERDIKGGGG